MQEEKTRSGEGNGWKVGQEVLGEKCRLGERAGEGEVERPELGETGFRAGSGVGRGSGIDWSALDWERQES